MDVQDLRAMDPGDIAVELKPHMGVRRTAAGAFNVRLPQSVIFVNGVHSGYVGDSQSSHISLIHSGLPKEVVAAIKTKVDAKRGTVTPNIVQAPTLQQSDVRLEAVEDDQDLLADEDI